jgi:hypothetical protein
VVFWFSNLKTGNFGSLIKVFLLRHPELEASVQTDNALFLWQVQQDYVDCIVQYSIVSYQYVPYSVNPEPIRIWNLDPRFFPDKIKKKYNWKISLIKNPYRVFKNEISSFFSSFGGQFWPAWIRIRNLNLDPDPDPLVYSYLIRIRIRNTANFPIWSWVQNLNFGEKSINKALNDNLLLNAH